MSILVVVVIHEISRAHKGPASIPEVVCHGGMLNILLEYEISIRGKAFEFRILPVLREHLNQVHQENGD